MKKPFCLMAKPVGSSCNLQCRYCYYSDKSWGQPSKMCEETLSSYIRQYIEVQPADEVSFLWHGGEPTLLSLDFYKHVVELQARFAGHKRITNCLQTNGTLLNDSWCEFFSKNKWLIGLSIDGPAAHHNRFRHDKCGNSTFDTVMDGIRLLKKHGVEWNAMATINSLNVTHPHQFYSFFKEIGAEFIQFTPIVERFTSAGRLAAVDEKGTITNMSVSPEAWGEFLITLVDIWRKNDIGKIFIQIFDAVLANHLGMEPGVCSLATHCGSCPVIDSDGSIYTCDHFVFPQYKIGNINGSSLKSLVYSEKLLEFGQSKTTSLPSECKSCRYLKLCNGECPKNRFMTDCHGQPGMNYLCKGYKLFFEHSEEFFENMAANIRMQMSKSHYKHEY